MENLCRSERFIVTFFSSRDQHVAVVEQRGAGPPAPRCHLGNHREPAGRRIVQLCRICASLSHPPSREQHLARTQQYSNVPDAPLAHLSRSLKPAGHRVIEFRGLVKILVTPHASSNQNLPVRKKSRRLPRARLKHRSGRRECSNPRSRRTGIMKGSGGQGKCDGEESN
jgi:hypothetical protein